MKTSEADILIVPGWSGSGPDHWQSRWLRQLKTARLVEQDDWLSPSLDAWVGRITEAVGAAQRPVLFVAHSVGCIAVAHAAAKLTDANIVGAFLVALADVDEADRWPVTNGKTFSECGRDFAPIPTVPLPFPSVVIGSSNDPYCREERAGELALAWGSVFVDAGASGHINVDSGFGPWPEGLMRLGWFLKKVS